MNDPLEIDVRKRVEAIAERHRARDRSRADFIRAVVRAELGRVEAPPPISASGLGPHRNAPGAVLRVLLKANLDPEHHEDYIPVDEIARLTGYKQSTVRAAKGALVKKHGYIIEGAPSQGDDQGYRLRF